VNPPVTEARLTAPAALHNPPEPRPVMVPGLVAVAHGTRDERGTAAVRALLEMVRAMRPEVPVVESYVEIAPPSLASALIGLDRSAVVVPLLLGAGYHVKTDLPAAITRSGAEAVVAAALGPHTLLVDALLDRLVEAGWRTGDTLVLAAAGSSDPASCADARLTAHLLADRTGAWVPTAYLSAARPTLAEAVEALRPKTPAGRRVVVAPYLLAPGYFYDRVLDVGADIVAAPLGSHEAVARLVLERYDAALPPPS
jgi:sirohydrochlorin ferrochelatase